jgi:hypothetical protein
MRHSPRNVLLGYKIGQIGCCACALTATKRVKPDREIGWKPGSIPARLAMSGERSLTHHQDLPCQREPRSGSAPQQPHQDLYRRIQWRLRHRHSVLSRRRLPSDRIRQRAPPDQQGSPPWTFRRAMSRRPNALGKNQGSIGCDQCLTSRRGSRLRCAEGREALGESRSRRILEAGSATYPHHRLCDEGPGARLSTGAFVYRVSVSCSRWSIRSLRRRSRSQPGAS